MMGDGIGGGEGLIYIRVWVGDRGWALSDSCFLLGFFIYAFVFCFLMPGVSFFK